MPASRRAGIFAPAPASGADGSEHLLSVTLVKSPIGQIERHKLTVKALGLRRMHQTVVRPDTQVVRGMVFAVQHLVRVEPAPEGAERTRTGRRGGRRVPERMTEADVAAARAAQASAPQESSDATA